MVLFFLLIPFFIVLVLTCLSSLPKYKPIKCIKPIVTRKFPENFTFTHTPVNNYIITGTTNDPEFLVDQSDILYYARKKNIDEAFQKECETRGLSLNEYIIDEILGINLQRDFEHHEHRELRDREQPLMYQDTQNVHDTTIQHQLKKTYQTIPKNSKTLFNEQEIIHQTELLGKDVETIKTVLETIKERNNKVVNFGDNEMTVLANTWKAGDDNIKEQIINNLIDCAKDHPLNTSVVCPTGVTSRIVESMYINDPETTPRTKDMYKEEMLNKASLVRNQLEQTTEYDKLTDDQQSLSLQKHIMDTLKQDYIDTHILNSHQLSEFTKDWIEHV